jgi:predicted DNA-binding transcriptional regulator YafY
VAFTYRSEKGETLRRQVKVARISTNSVGTVYLHGFCLLRNEQRTFKVCNITTKILEKSKRWDVVDWIENVSGLAAHA